MASPLIQFKEIWSRMSASGRVATVAAVVGTLGLIGALFYYGSQPNYGVLFTKLTPEDAQKISEKLKVANVPYTLTDSGTVISVPEEKIQELRIKMASEGAITGGHVGFDLFDKTSFGATDFAQQINYRRAIEGELAKTLEAMDEVESARVHVTPKKESVFTEKEDGAKASVVVRIRQNKELSSERSNAIVSLVASSIEGLEPTGVSVMDTSGRLLVAAGKHRPGGMSDTGAFTAQLESKRKFEAESATRLIALIEPVVGYNRVRADVSADIDFSQTEQSEEKFDPKSQVVRSQQVGQEIRNNPAQQVNAPVGARSNNPQTMPTPVIPVTATAAATADQRNTSTVNYEIDKTIKKTIGGGGRVNKLNVSVVVDHKSVEGVEVARTADEIKQIQDLVAAAVGIDAARGDTVVVQTMPFSKPQIEPATSTSFLDKNKALIPTVIKYGTLVLIAILLLIFVIRPARKALKAASVAAEETKLLAEGSSFEERRAAQAETPRQIDRGTPDHQQMMTVSELQAEINGENGHINADAERIEAIRRQIAAQSIDDTDLVVSTMRGWLRENA
ncbi:MAG TPA: flagellar basal-body MS-ring/collar protein FliF [Pyrinomonadaceae bacterium]|nr:flagellar M-ring protein FliF [Acidobacteriota bacterium]HQZ95552.1 flagellar basal-body MS-ring/collar protein FliF [Pyrinomonadaceae bacterium]